MSEPEPRPGDTVEFVECINTQAPVGSRWRVLGVFDGVLSPGRYLDLEGCPVAPRVDRCRVVGAE